jgi:hypothetical protein
MVVNPTLKEELRRIQAKMTTVEMQSPGDPVVREAKRVRE